MLSILIGYAGFFLHKPRVIPKTLKGIFYRVILRKPYLRVAEIATTFLCNSDCVMCSCSKFCNVKKEKNRLTVSEYENLGRQLDDLDCISVNITGGEPLLRKDIVDVVEAINTKTKIVNLITNGINLSEEKLANFKQIGIDSIVVSLESTDESENDVIRGHEGHFKMVMRIIDWAHKINLKMGISLTLGDFNFDKVYEMITFAKGKTVFLCIAHGGNIGNWANNDKIFLSEENAKRILYLIKKHKDMKIDFSANLSLKPGCPAMREKIYITPYGDILPCTFNPISFGNLRNKSLQTIWKRMLAFRKEKTDCDSLCIRTYDKNYIKDFLDPIRDLDLPVNIDKHSHYKIKD